jgi:hypothetical protein
VIVMPGVTSLTAVDGHDDNEAGCDDGDVSDSEANDVAKTESGDASVSCTFMGTQAYKSESIVCGVNASRLTALIETMYTPCYHGATANFCHGKKKYVVAKSKTHQLQNRYHFCTTSKRVVLCILAYFPQ